MKIALRISYLGTKYNGWQSQPSTPAASSGPLITIQDTVETAVSRMFDTPTRVVASGRTDAGVHSYGQVAHFWLNAPDAENRFPMDTIKRGLNSNLPTDIRVMKAWVVPDDFHAQHSAEKKQYSFLLQQGPTPLPQWMETSWWIHRRLNIEAMQEAISHLRGEHDFKAFMATGSKELKSTVRNILEAEVTREPIPGLFGDDLNDEGFSFVRIRLIGTGFLKQMVRGIVGTLVPIGEGLRQVIEMKDILDSQDRRKVGPTAPSRGLTLDRVWYKTDPHGNSN
ncbi:MAG: tRNA pseudouridine(38-40) synthase TruA [Bdellovibrionales bacterium]|nr:tRNA pseudouridine(38-40) synthase TruA [Bdellovibrionales bacterium]